MALQDGPRSGGAERFPITSLASPTFPSSSSLAIPAPAYVSSRSANALISDLRPTTLFPSTLHHLNLLLDELLTLLISHAGSIDPSDIKRKSIPLIFNLSNPVTSPRPDAIAAPPTTGSIGLSREVISEAELELLAWRERKLKSIRRKSVAKGLSFPDDPEELARIRVDGFGRDVGGMKDTGKGAFPVREALEMLRYKIIGYSTLAAAAVDAELDKLLSDAWVAVGGSIAEDVVAPAALYFTAILEHICEHILTNLGRVIARDSTSAQATLQDLYIALCEDESIFGVFKKMTVKTMIEAELRMSQEQPLAGRVNKGTLGRKSSRVPVPSIGSFDLPRSERPSADYHSGPSGGIESPTSSTFRKPHLAGRASIEHSHGPSISSSSASGATEYHKRNASILSNTTKDMLGAMYHEEATPRTSNVATLPRPGASTSMEDDFDRLLNSGATMKVSLTPSRLKTYDAGKQSPAKSPSQGLLHRAKMPTITSSPTQRSPFGSPNTNSPGFGSPDGSSANSPYRQRLIPRNAGQPDSEEEVLDGERDGTPKARENLLDVLSSEPPWSQVPGPAPAWGQARDSPPVIRVKDSALASPGRSPKPDAMVSRGDASPQRAVFGTPAAATELRRKPSVVGPAESFRSLEDARTNRGDQPPVDTPKGRRSSKPKTQTQELADFFASTVPPDTHMQRLPMDKRDSVDMDGRNAGRLKGFLSKLTGNKSRVDLGAADLNEGGPSRRGSGEPELGRKISMSAIKAGPSSYQDMEPLRRRSSNRAPPRRPSQAENPSNVEPLSHDKLISGLKAVTQPPPGTDEDKPPRTPGAVKLEEIFPRAGTTSDGTIRQAAATLELPVPPPVGQVHRSTEMNNQAASSDAPRPVEKVTLGGVARSPIATSGGQVDRVVNGAQAAVAPPGTAIITSMDLPTLDAPADEPDVAAVRATESDVHQRGQADALVQDETADVTGDHRFGLHDWRQHNAPTRITSTDGRTATRPEGSISLDRLASMRHLLRHATSADECRLLVNSLLLSWGVPVGDMEAIDQPTQESLLTTWLLTGSVEPPIGPVVGLNGSTRRDVEPLLDAKGLANSSDASFGHSDESGLVVPPPLDALE